MRIKLNLTIVLCLVTLILLSSCQSNSEKQLTLDKIRSLSENKGNLSWNDFEGYPFEDIGSGLYIRKYNVEDKYQLLISGASIDDKPKDIHLVKPNGEKIDIRYDDIDSFLLE